MHAHVPLARIRAATTPVIVGTLSLLPAAATHAQSSALQRAKNAAQGSGIGTSSSLESTVGTLIQTALGTLGAIFLVITIYAGFLWMTAAGNEEKVSTAKKLMVRAVVGMAIVLSAMAITSFVVDALVASSGSSV